MSTNCSVKKYKGSVVNDNMDYLGYLKFGVTNLTVPELQNFSLSVEGIGKIIGGTVNGGTTFTIPANTVKWLLSYSVVISGDEAQILLPKYTLNTLNLYRTSFDMNELAYTTITSFVSNLCDFVINYDVLKSCSVLELKNATFDKPFDCSKLDENCNFTSVLFTGSTNAIGTLDKLGFSPLTSLTVPGSKSVTLNISNFVANNRTDGRTTGSLNIKWLGACNAIFNGQAVSILQENNELSWTATTITLNGQTITA